MAEVLGDEPATEEELLAMLKDWASHCMRSLSCKLLAMRHDQSRLRQHRPRTSQVLRLVGVLLLAVELLVPATAQDIQGVEICTAEKQMERRTGCLQANVEFLQRALSKLTHETQDKAAAVDRDLAAARAEIAALKSTVEKLNGELAQIKAKPDNAKK